MALFLASYVDSGQCSEAAHLNYVLYFLVAMTMVIGEVLAGEHGGGRRGGIYTEDY
jgi:hypothetical protein